MLDLQSRRVIQGAAIALTCLATPAVAQDRTALVIANSAYPGPAALPDIRRSALNVSEALLGLGFAVDRLENPTAGEMQTAISALQAGEGVSLVYYAGRTRSLDDASFLVPVAGGDGVAIAPLIEGGSDDPRFVFIDMCHDVVAETDDAEPDVVVPLSENLAQTVDASENLVFAASVEPGEACAMQSSQNLTDMLLGEMNVPGLDASQMAAVAAAEDENSDEDALYVASTLQDPFVFRTATSDARLTAEDYAVLDRLSPAARDQMIAMWKSAGMAVDVAGSASIAPTSLAPVASTANTVVLVAPVAPVSATIIAPVSPRASSGSGTTTLQPSSGGVTLIAGGATAPAPAVFRATPGEDGLPAPSILVGFVTEEIEPDVAPEVNDSPLAGSGLSYDDLDARNAMRNGNPEVFASLVESGAFDPPDAELAAAIQTELARMNCYRSTIDGIWGPGSRRSVTAYYEEIDGATPSQDPDPRIFRAIIARDDVRCPDPPAPVAAAPAPRRATTTQAAPRQAAPVQQAAPRAAAPAPAAPAPAAPARRTINQGATGTGNFR